MLTADLFAADGAVDHGVVAARVGAVGLDLVFPDGLAGRVARGGNLGVLTADLFAADGAVDHGVVAAGGGAVGLDLVFPDGLAGGVARGGDRQIGDLDGKIFVLEILAGEIAAFGVAVPVGLRAGLGAGGENLIDADRVMDVGGADPDEAVQNAPVILAVGVEVDVDLAGVLGVHGVLGVVALGIPAGDPVVLHLDDLDLLTLSQLGVQQVLVVIVGVLSEDVPGVDAVDVPIGPDQVVAVEEQTDVFAGEFLTADGTVDDLVEAALYAESGLCLVLDHGLAGGVARGLVRHGHAGEFLAADGAVDDLVMAAGLGAGGGDHILLNSRAGGVAVGREEVVVHCIAAVGAHIDGVALLGAGRRDDLLRLVGVACGLDGLGLDLVADGALAGPLAVLGAGGGGGNGPFAPVVARSLDHRGLGRVAAGAFMGLLAVLGAGGLSDDGPLAPVVAGGGIHELVLGKLFGQLLVGEDQAFQRTVGSVAVVVAQGAVHGAGGRDRFHIHDIVLVHGGRHQLVQGDGLLVASIIAEPRAVAGVVILKGPGIAGNFRVSVIEGNRVRYRVFGRDKGI